MSANTQATQSVQRFERLEVRHIHGYVAIHPRRNKSSAGWLYLRKHSKDRLFIGNLPQPHWFAHGLESKQNTSEDVQKRMQSVIKYMLPSAESVETVFSTKNGRLATRVSMKDGEKGVDEVLERPGEYLDVDWERLVEGVGGGEEIKREGVVERWLREYEEERDEENVRRWSEAAMKAYEAREKARKEEKERQRRQVGKVDDDGFVLVTNGAKQIKAAEAVKMGRKGKGEKGGGRKRKGLLDLEKGIEKEGFYRWQRERQSTLRELQSKFKEDQKRIRAIGSLKESN